MPHLLGPRVSVMLLCSYCLCNFAVGVCAALAASFAAFADPFVFSSVAAVWCSLLFVLQSCVLFCTGIHDHGQMLGLITRCEHMEFLTHHMSNFLARVANLTARADSEDPPRDKTSFRIAARATTFSEFALLFTSGGDETGVDVHTTCAEEEEFSGHYFVECGGFFIFPHFSHRSLSLLDQESELCENLHLSPRSQVHVAKCLQGIVVLYASLWSCGTLSHPGRVVIETSVCIHVEVFDSVSDRLQGLHHRFFGWRISSCMQFFEVCEPLSHQQQLRLVSARDGLGKPLRSPAMCSAVLTRISLCNTLKITQTDDRSAPRRLETSCRRC